MTLATRPATTILTVADEARAKDFYEGALGLPVRGKDPTGMTILGLAGSASLGLMVDANAVHSGHTALTFEVDDLESAMADLEGHGVHFEDYDLPDLKTDEHHIYSVPGERSSWFADPDGNILCLHEGGVTEYTM
ncbi:glyoxalase/bleomycin resistance/dioxygenase family protein [Sinomonas notoginsengisoli]|uniref:VOC family protein n=1 Tax=Sinomonas notoginsengisoli TaxID=1457311 RepID=UPI001F1C8CA4|nr:VOC family protein [Sinomonas notoginsengisoli]